MAKSLTSVKTKTRAYSRAGWQKADIGRIEAVPMKTRAYSKAVAKSLTSVKTKTRAYSKAGYISAVGVSAAFRGRGLGKLLVVAGVEQIEVEARIFV